MKLDEALECYEKGVALDPNNAQMKQEMQSLMNLMGRISLFQNNFQKELPVLLMLSLKLSLEIS